VLTCWKAELCENLCACVDFCKSVHAKMRVCACVCMFMCLHVHVCVVCVVCLHVRVFACACMCGVCIRSIHVPVHHLLGAQSARGRLE
jgi:hypothetical protein